VFDEHLDALYRTALRCGGTATEAEDLLQETALSAYRHFDRLRDAGASRPWLFKILLRTHLNRTRARARRLEVVASQLEEDAYENALAAWRPTPTPEQILDWRRTGEGLSAALNEISPSLRIVVWLIDVEGFKQREVARMLEISEGTVASRLFRAHQRLRERLIRSPESGGRQEER
jgi:RNA polymerase sigma-70 factor (ECF subfamily)